MNNRRGESTNADHPGLSRAVRIGVGLLAGIGATGIYAALGIVGTLLAIDVPFIHLDSLISLAAVVVIAALAGAVLRGPAAITSIAMGAVASPVAAALAIDGSCEPNIWVGFGLFVAAIYALFVTLFAALVGNLYGRSARVERNREGGAWALVLVGIIGLIGWIAAVARVGGCS